MGASTRQIEETRAKRPTNGGSSVNRSNLAGSSGATGEKVVVLNQMRHWGGLSD